MGFGKGWWGEGVDANLSTWMHEMEFRIERWGMQQEHYFVMTNQ